jgi:hypothetical protein
MLSILMIAALVLAINFAPMPDGATTALVFAAITVAATGLFIIRQRQATNPLYDLRIASRRIFWVAAVAGIIVFGTLMGSMYIGQQFLQNVLGYDTLEAGASAIPMSLAMVAVAALSARMVVRLGSRMTLMIGYLFFVLAFVVMLVLWDENTSYAGIALAYLLIGVGVGLAGTPASHSLTASVPVHRAGMASGTADLQRDLGGAVMQSILGALLTVGYAASISAAVSNSPDANKVTDTLEAQLQKSFAGAQAAAEQYPQYADAITAAAKTAFLQGANWAYAAGIVAILIGAAITWLRYPDKAGEQDLLGEYASEDLAKPETAGKFTHS